MGAKHVVIVGAGPGGLATAMLLAQRGVRVTVLEKADRIGGRNAEVVLDGYRFDLGPTFLMMKFLLDELFETVGRDSSSYLDFRRLDPMYRLLFDERTMLVRSHPDDMRASIESVFPGEGAGLDQFLASEKARFAKLYPCLQKGFSSIFSVLNPRLINAAPHIAAGRSLYSVLSDYFHSEELRLAFTFQSKYLGMSPWDCPGLFAMIPYTEHAHGIYHVQGGLCRIPEAFAKVALEDGAEIRTSAPVKRVLVENGASCGVELESGEKIPADDVVINADFGYAMQHLFPSEALGKYAPAKLKKRKFSCSTFMMYLGIDRVYPEAEHHMIVFARDYKKCLDDITRTKTVSEDLSVYIRNAAPLDPQCAPEGHSALYVLAPVPNNMSGIDWEEHRAGYREMILSLLEARTPYKDLRRHIRKELIVTPADWEKERSIFLGATFNMSHDWNQMLHMRPHNEFEMVRNTYLVGGGTHPGSGLPTIFESARISSNLILKKYGISFPAPKPFPAEEVA